MLGRWNWGKEDLGMNKGNSRSMRNDKSTGRQIKPRESSIARRSTQFIWRIGYQSHKVRFSSIVAV